MRQTPPEPPGQPADAGQPVSDFDIAMMRLALAEADTAATLGEVPVGCIVTVCGPAGPEVIARGHNLRELTQDPTAHAEMLAITAAARQLGSWRLNPCTLYVTLEPCPMCAGAIVNSRMGRVVYGADDPKAGACRSLFALTTDVRLNHRVVLVGSVLADESAARLREFFAARRQRSRSAGALGSVKGVEDAKR